VESPFDVFSTTSFILLVLLGLRFCLPPTDYEMEVEAGRSVMIALMHLKGPTTLLPRLRRADLGGRHAVMRYNGEGMHAPFLEVSPPVFFPDLEWRHVVLPSTRLR
jgi:hypothetical protein